LAKVITLQLHDTTVLKLTAKYWQFLSNQRYSSASILINNIIFSLPPAILHSTKLIAIKKSA